MAAQVFMVASGKGGTGKSTLSVHLGGALAAQGHCVVLVEMDVGLRNVDLLAGASDSVVFDLGDVLNGRCSPTKALVKSSVYSGLFVLCAPLAGKLDSEVFASFISALRDSVDYIILDTAAGLGDIFQTAAACLVPSDTVLLVLTPDIISARDGRMAVQELQKMGIGAQQRVVFNKVGATIAGGLQSLDDALDAVGAQLIGVVPYAPEIPETIGQPLKVSLARTAVQNIALRLQGTYVPLAVS